MRKILLMIISGVSFCTIPVHAQFCTIATTPQRYKVEALYEDMKKPEPMPGSTVPVQEMASEGLGVAETADVRKKIWIDAISACLSLRRIPPPRSLFFFPPPPSPPPATWAVHFRIFFCNAVCQIQNFFFVVSSRVKSSGIDQNVS